MRTCHKRQSNRVSAMDNARASTITFKCHAGNEFIESLTCTYRKCSNILRNVVTSVENYNEITPISIVCRSSVRIFTAPSRFTIIEKREGTNLERRTRETSETASPCARSNRCIAAARFEPTIRPCSPGFGQPRPPSTRPKYCAGGSAEREPLVVGDISDAHSDFSQWMKSMWFRATPI